MSKLTGTVQNVAADLFSNSANQLHELGAKVVTNDGRAFRYAKAGAADLVAGNLLQAPAIVANHQNMATSTQAAGDTTVTVTLGATAATANQYAGGFLTLNAGTGKGYSLRIKSHPAANSGATLVLTLEDPFQVATSSSDTKSCLIANPYSGVIQMPTTATSSAVGVATYIISAGQYGWIQVHGPVSVLSDASIAAVGLGLIPSTTTAGCVTVSTATGGNIGYALQAGVSAETRTHFITIE